MAPPIRSRPPTARTTRCGVRRGRPSRPPPGSWNVVRLGARAGPRPSSPEGDRRYSASSRRRPEQERATLSAFSHRGVSRAPRGQEPDGANGTVRHRGLGPDPARRRAVHHVGPSVPRPIPALLLRHPGGGARRRRPPAAHHANGQDHPINRPAHLIRGLPPGTRGSLPGAPSWRPSRWGSRWGSRRNPHRKYPAGTRAFALGRAQHTHPSARDTRPGGRWWPCLTARRGGHGAGRKGPGPRHPGVPGGRRLLLAARGTHRPRKGRPPGVRIRRPSPNTPSRGAALRGSPRPQTHSPRPGAAEAPAAPTPEGGTQSPNRVVPLSLTGRACSRGLSHFRFRSHEGLLVDHYVEGPLSGGSWRSTAVRTVALAWLGRPSGVRIRCVVPAWPATGPGAGGRRCRSARWRSVRSVRAGGVVARDDPVRHVRHPQAHAPQHLQVCTHSDKR